MIAPSPSISTSATRSVRRYWIFRIVIILFVCSIFPGIELVLYLLDVGTDTSLVLPAHRIPGSCYYLNPRADFAYCVEDLRGPEPRAFELPKPDGAFRVVIVGESTVQGYPYPSELSFPRQMQLILERQLPGKSVEVLNAGIIGLSSVPLVDVVQQVMKAQPDVVVLYTGHNEFYGVGGVSTNATLSQISILSRRFRLIQYLTSLLSGSSPSGELVSRMPKNVEVSLDSPLRSAAERQYESSLVSMCEICSRHGVPVVLCGVASNLRDQSPLPQAVSDVLVEKTVRHLQKLDVTNVRSDAIPDLISEIRAALKREPANAALHFRLGQCLERSGESREASSEFILARESDPCRYRASSKFRDIASQAADRFSKSGATFVDIESACCEASGLSAPGHDLFLEHVHFNSDGNWLVARTLARSIIEKHLSRTWDESLVPSVADRNEWLGLLVEDECVAVTLAGFLTQSSPFNRVIDLKNQQRALQSSLEQLVTTLSEERLKIFVELDGKTKVDDLVDGIGRAYLDRGRAIDALQFFEIGSRRRPWMPNSNVFSAIALHQLQRDLDARRELYLSVQTVFSASPPLAKARDRVQLQVGQPVLPDP